MSDFMKWYEDYSPKYRKTMPVDHAAAAYQAGQGA